MARQRLRTILTITFVLCALIPLAGMSRGALRAAERNYRADSQQPPLYLPEKRYVRLITLGFNSFASDIMWFNLLNYFGRQFQGDRDYRWLNNMCALITDLDTRALHVFEFCGTMLAWETKQFSESTKLLSQAIERHPDQWRFRYMRGFNHWYFHEDKALAQADFVAASKLPNAPPFLASIASRMLVEQDDINTAIEFLQQMLERTTDLRAKEAIADKIKKGYLKKDLDFLTEAVERYRKKFQAIPSTMDELVTLRIITKLPNEPFGGKYKLDPTTGLITTTSGQKPLEFYGKTAKTGAARREFQ